LSNDLTRNQPSSTNVKMDYHQHLNINESKMNTSMNMDETEDEEVKENCFGMKQYTETSESDSDSDDEEPSFPVNFRCEKPIGCKVIRPKPRTPKHQVQEETQETTKDHNYHYKKYIIHNECEFSDDSGSSYEEEESDSNDNDDNSSLHLTPSPIFQDADNSSEDDEDLSECDDASKLSDDSSEGSVVAEACADDEDEDLDNDDEENYADAEDESDDEDDGSDSSISSEESLGEDVELEKKNNGHKIVLEWDHGLSHSRDSEQPVFDPGHDTDHVAEYSEPVLATKVSGSFSECSDYDDSDSISAEAIKNVIEHPEKDASVMCFSESEEVQDEMMATLVDTSKEDGSSSSSSIPSQKSLKRTLSTSLCDDEGVVTNISPDQVTGSVHKRNCRRISLPFKKESCGGVNVPISTISSPPFLPSLSLGSPLDLGLLQRRGSPDDFSSDGDAVVDSQLADELDDVENYNTDTSTTRSTHGASPVPLLTPPGTPVTYNNSQSGIMGTPICEWPSNLTVDIALTSAIELRPLPLSTIAKFEEQDVCAEDFQSPLPPTRARSISEPSSTTGLTPLVGSLGMPRLHR